MKSNLSIRLFNELTRKGYRVEDLSDISENNLEMLNVQINLNKLDTSFWLTLFVPRNERPLFLGQISLVMGKSISNEKREQALEYINSINQTGFLTYLINNQNQITIQRWLFSNTIDLFDQYMTFVELFPNLFQDESVITNLNKLLSL